MARITSTGFELNSATQGVEFANISGSPTISSTTVRSGSFAGRITSLASGTQKRFRLQFVASGTGGNGPYFYRVYFNTAVLPSAENRIISSRDSNAGADRAYITIDNGGLLRLYNGAGTQIGSASSALSTGTWYRIEFKLDRTPAGGSQIIEALLNGIVFATSSSQTITSNIGDTLQLGGNLNSEAQTTGDWFFDDIAVNDSTGSFQTSYPGDGHIVHLRPSGTGDSNGFLTAVGGTAGSANNYTRVSETTPDDASSYNGSAVLSAEDLFATTTPNIGANDIINIVSLGVRMADLVSADATASFKVELEKKSNGVKSQSAALIPNSTSWKTNSATSAFPLGYPLTTYQAPDGDNWTYSDMETLQIGYIQTAINVQTIAVSTIWALVDYTSESTTSVNRIGNYGRYVSVGDGMSRSEVSY